MISECPIKYVKRYSALLTREKQIKISLNTSIHQTKWLKFKTNNTSVVKDVEHHYWWVVNWYNHFRKMAVSTS